MDIEEREATTAGGRSLNVVHVLPQSTESVPRFLRGPLERIDPAVGETQLLVLTSDSEAAIALAETVLQMTGPAGIELFPVTTGRRAARLLRSRSVHALAGAPRDVAELIRGSHLKLENLRSIVIAWADDVLGAGAEDLAALEAVMSEVPKDATRVIVTAIVDEKVDAFVERYLRRARRIGDPPVAETEPVAITYLPVSPASRPFALRRLLDDLDPPSVAVVAPNDAAAEEAGRALRALGYLGGPELTVTTGAVEPDTFAVIFYGLPANREQLRTAARAVPVKLIALIQPRELSALRSLAGSAPVPLVLESAAQGARSRERAVRRELEEVLDEGLPYREVLALEPLLERRDAVELAAAALRLLEREREKKKAAPVVPPTRPASGGGDFRRSPSDTGRPPQRGTRSFAEGGRGSGDRKRERPPQGGRPPRGGPGGHPKRDERGGGGKDRR